ncbi:MAG: hypothetical protein ABIZ80_12115, partial [Bryobacteraceae bacterium]
MALHNLFFQAGRSYGLPLILLLATSFDASGAIFPDRIGPAERGEVKALAVSGQTLWSEYGL